MNTLKKQPNTTGVPEIDKHIIDENSITYFIVNAFKTKQLKLLNSELDSLKGIKANMKNNEYSLDKIHNIESKITVIDEMIRYLSNDTRKQVHNITAS